MAITFDTVREIAYTLGDVEEKDIVWYPCV